MSLSLDVCFLFSLAVSKCFAYILPCRIPFPGIFSFFAAFGTVNLILSGIFLLASVPGGQPPWFFWFPEHSFFGFILIFPPSSLFSTSSSSHARHFHEVLALCTHSSCTVLLHLLPIKSPHVQKMPWSIYFLF